MFGIGPTELLIIGLLALLVFGPEKLANMARDFGRFVTGAQNTVEEFKSELHSEEVKEVHRTAEEFKSEIISARRSVEEFKGETRRSVEELKKTEVAVGQEGGAPASDPPPDREEETRKPKEKEEPPRKEETTPATTTRAEA